MTEKAELWDDSALINAFDDAVSKYKMMHVIGENVVTSKEEENIPADKGSNELNDLQSTNENYDELLNKYYEVEEQRQKILEKLNQFGNPVSSTFPTSQGQNQTYDTTTYYCPYGCQNWTVPCSDVDQNYSKGGENEKSKSHEDKDFDAMAQAAVERALHSLTNEEYSSNDGVLANGECKKSPTDLAVVLNAWYSAGLYTGKYLSEQSMEKRKHG